MSLLEILLIALGLAADAFTVALAAGAGGRARGWRAAFRLSFHFGLFQALMPVAGWHAGYLVAGPLATYGRLLAFGLLVLVGVHMILPARDRRVILAGDPSRGWRLVALALATSIDALAVGLSLALLRVPVWYPSAVIGLVTAGLVVLAFALGRRLAERWGRSMEIAGGLLLIAIGVKIVAGYLAG